MNNNLRRYCKMLLKEAGIKVFQKDIENYQCFSEFPHGGMDHKIETRITMRDGVSYTVFRETRDKEGKFSFDSAAFYVSGLEIRG